MSCICGVSAMKCAFADRAKALRWTANAIREITQLFERLEDGAERLRSFVEKAPVAMSMFGSDMRYVAASSSWKSDRGLGDVHLAGRLHCELFPNFSQRWKEVCRRGFAGESLREELDDAPGWQLAVAELGNVALAYACGRYRRHFCAHRISGGGGLRSPRRQGSAAPARVY